MTRAVRSLSRTAVRIQTVESRGSALALCSNSLLCIYSASLSSSRASRGPMAVLLASLRLTAGREQPGSVWYSNVSTPLSGTYLRRVTVVRARVVTHARERTAATSSEARSHSR